MKITCILYEQIFQRIAWKTPGTNSIRNEYGWGLCFFPLLFFPQQLNTVPMFLSCKQKKKLHSDSNIFFLCFSYVRAAKVRMTEQHNLCAGLPRKQYDCLDFILGKRFNLYSSLQKPKTFQDFSSHRILGHMHESLDIDEKKTKCTVCL